MTVYSVWGGGAYPTQAAVANAGEVIRLGNGFRLTANLADWMCVGARLFVDPANVAELETTFTMYAFAAPDFSGTPLQTKTGSVGVGGWRTVSWDTPFEMPNDQAKVYIAYQFGTTQRFLSSGTGTSGAYVSADTAFLEFPPAASGRTYYQLSGGGTTLNTDGVLYGVDILVDDGSIPLEPIGFTATRMTTTTALLEWTDPGDAPNGVDVLRAPIATQVDGSGDEYGDPGYDPSTITGATYVATGVTSPFTDTSLDPATTYTYALIRSGSA